tara:strand:+ start:818 stop:1327 length:510 start_codon:yes stop_codon:yes gene_type:complete
MEYLKIILASILLSITYGITHDLITTQISIEYFTIGHPIIIDTNSPILLALLWGTIATWWVGLIIGILISFSSRLGSKPKLNLKDVFKPILKLITAMFAGALLGGLIGYITSINQIFTLVPRLAKQIDPSRHHLFLTAGWAHTSSYIIGFIGGITLCVKIILRRSKNGG